MGWLTVLTSIAPLVFGLMKVVRNENIPGEDKKKTVVSIVKGAVHAMPSVTTGGAQETWKILEPILTAPAEEGGLIEGFYEAAIKDTFTDVGDR
jgi:hypothetical protein